MFIILPLYVSAVPAELAGFPAVLVALIGHTHEAGKLNARRRDRLVAAVEALQRPRWPQRWPRRWLTGITWTRRCWTWR